jgi:1-deoxy-D-xylulose-5-phosphate reductoisomerase
MKTLAIIGSTGSIGKSTLNIYKKNKNKFKLLYLCCDKNYLGISRQIQKFNPSFFYLNKIPNNKIFSKNNNFKSIDFFIKKKIKIDYVVSGVSGFNSIPVNLKLLKISKNLLIANKETIVCCGNIFLRQAKKNNCNILPIDSEHYCVNFFLENFKLEKKDIKKIILTASGGPFLYKKIKYKEKIKKVLEHPNWSMGKKISVDSSTMANKVMEMFEAKVLFNIPNDLIDVKIENQSLIHSIIVLKNNLNFFIAHETNMEIPIANSLGCNNKFNLKINNISVRLENVNFKKFPLVKLGYKILNYSNGGMILFTVLNERLVNLYLNNKIFYGDITTRLTGLFKKNKIVKLSKKCIKNQSELLNFLNLSKRIKLL